MSPDYAQADSLPKRYLVPAACGEIMDRTESSVTTETAERRKYEDRALRHELQLPLRYRVEGQKDWSAGQTLNLSESGLLFSSDDILEINTRVEITFQTMGVPMLQSSTRIADVVRRVLNNWPETRPIFGARFRT
jgi:hypothetical protein